MASSPWSAVSDDDLKSIAGVCFDIDETFSTRGKITAEAYEALWRLKKAGFATVPITGRPSGWCDHIARFWPVDAVVGENGAFVFYLDRGRRKRLNFPAPSGERTGEIRSSLTVLKEKLNKEFPEIVLASDQAYRESDLAIDISEDVTPWKAARVQELIEFCETEGAHAKLSSVHVNVWFGDYNKKAGFNLWLEKKAPGCTNPEIQKDRSIDRWIFIGDSPNDEPLFRAFKSSVGVANIKKYLNLLKHHPRWVTESESGAGFCEMAARLVGSRG